MRIILAKCVKTFITYQIYIFYGFSQLFCQFVHFTDAHCVVAVSVIDR